MLLTDPRFLLVCISCGPARILFKTHGQSSGPQVWGEAQRLREVTYVLDETVVMWSSVGWMVEAVCMRDLAERIVGDGRGWDVMGFGQLGHEVFGCFARDWCLL